MNCYTGLIKVAGGTLELGFKGEMSVSNLRSVSKS
jgi:hypothetical protein